MTEAIQWQGELGQDRFVAEILCRKKHGYFVEFGAMTGREYSNTWAFEKYFDWQGILSEPNPRFHTELAQNRSCVIDNRAFWHTSGLQLDFICRHHGYSGLVQNDAPLDGQVIKVDTVTLNDVLDHHQAPDVIDYISMDTEGTELEILRAFDFNRRLVLTWTIEHNFHAEPRAAIQKIMRENDYRWVQDKNSGYDDWYVHASVGDRV